MCGSLIHNAEKNLRAQVPRNFGTPEIFFLCPSKTKIREKEKPYLTVCCLSDAVSANFWLLWPSEENLKTICKLSLTLKILPISIQERAKIAT